MFSAEESENLKIFPEAVSVELNVNPYRIKAVLFDFDGTLTCPGALDFKSIKEAIGCPLEMSVLEFIDSISDPRRKKRTLDIVDRAEYKAAELSFPNGETEELIAYIQSKGLKLGIITRNSCQSIMRAFENFEKTSPGDFDLIISRDDRIKPKPSGDGILFAAKHFKVKPSEILVTGDFIFDIQAGNNAGALTAYLDHKIRSEKVGSTFTVNTLQELKTIIRIGIEPENFPSFTI